jgi:hypothetical protein
MSDSRIQSTESDEVAHFVVPGHFPLQRFGARLPHPPQNSALDKYVMAAHSRRHKDPLSLIVRIRAGVCSLVTGMIFFGKTSSQIHTQFCHLCSECWSRDAKTTAQCPSVNSKSYTHPSKQHCGACVDWCSLSLSLLQLLFQLWSSRLVG